MREKTENHSDELTVAGVRITHPDRIMFPESGVTKGAVAAYYHAMADRMMPFLANRPISTVRCPKGVGDSCFYRKHPARGAEGVGIVSVTGKDGNAEEYFYIENETGLLHEVQMNTVEFHLWGSRVDALERPDMMVFDLDPDAGMGLDHIRQGVRDLKSILDGFLLTSYLKTSGGKGYHVVIPFKPTGGWEAFKDFAQNVAKRLEAKWPKRYTSKSRKAERQGRIYIDWLRNIRGATNVSPYSLRSRTGAPVSMPIHWEELDVIAPAEVTLEKALERIALKDPWSTFFTIPQELKPDGE